MCFNISAAAWATTTIPGLRKFVFLALCDRADKAGKCWPSMDWIAARCGISERAARSHVSALVQQGLVRREFRPGRSGIYHVNVTPAIPAAPPLPIRAATPANAAPIFNHDPIIQTINIAVAIPVVDVQVMQDFKAIRKAKRRPELTQTEIAALTAEGDKAGLTLTEVLKTCVVRGWTRFEATWLPAATPAPTPPPEPVQALARAETVSEGVGRLASLRSAIKSAMCVTGSNSLAWAHAAIAKKKAGEYVAQQAVRQACAALKMDYRIAFI